MKRTLFAISLLVALHLFATIAFAKEAPKAPAKNKNEARLAPPARSAVERLTTATGALSKLDYQKPKDRARAEGIVLETLSEFEKFEQLPAKDPQRLPLFENLVEFAREGGPYDGESSMGNSLGDWTSKHADLKAAYEAKSAGFPAKTKIDRCKNERLKSSVKEASCLAKDDLVPGQGGAKKEAQAMSCIVPFDFEGCLKKW